MEISKIRQKILLLNKRRHELLKQACQPIIMVCGSLYQMQRTCGNHNCKCAKGQKHISWYLSERTQGKTKLIYIGRIIPPKLKKYVNNYKRYQKYVVEIRKLDRRISLLLNQMKEKMTKKSEDIKR